MGITNPPAPRFQGRFDTLLRTCKDKVLAYCDARLGELFNNTDQALLDFAEKAESDAMQGSFFDAMREVRKKRPLVEHAFREEVESAFDLFGQWDRPGFSAASYRGVDLKEMSLVAQDDVEESVAIENIIAKARDAYYEELYALSQRFAVINGGRQLKDRAIPSGPHHLAGAFQSAAREIKVDAKIKLILFALFEKYVLKQAKSIYDELNTDCIAAGILPDLKPVFQRQAGDGATHHGPSGAPRGSQHHARDGATVANPESDEVAAKIQQDAYTGGVSDNLGEELLSSILSLMAGRGGATRRTVPGNPVPTATVVSAIECLQPARSAYTSGAGGDIDALPHPEADRVFRGQIRHTLAEERQRLFTEVHRDQMDALDADTIDLVGMLFQYMLDDPALPNVAKALISHLHTPYLKVAIIDRQLLTEDEHPARGLLNDLVEAGSEWVYEHDLNRGIFPAMKATVDRVLREFSDNVRLFDEFLAEFRVAVGEQKRKAGAIEKRSQQAVKEREKLHSARQRAVQEIDARTQQACLPQLAFEFLTQSWTDKLTFILLRHPDGDLSDDWTEALRIADDLVRVFDPETSAAVRRALVKVLCLLQEPIEVGLSSLGIDHDQCAALFGLMQSPESLPADQEILPEGADSKRLPTTLPAQETQPTAKTAATESASRARTKEELTPRQEAVLRRLREVKFGTWFEFCDRDSGKRRRLKLSWFGPQTSTCMFVDGSGVQAAVKSMPELAIEIADGHAKLIQGARKPFVERALESIRNMLQHGTAQTS